MSASTPPGGTTTVEQIITNIKALSLEDRITFFIQLKKTRSILRGTGFMVMSKRLFDAIMNWIPEVGRQERQAAKDRMKERNRRPDKNRLERGKIVLKANRDGISWKNMPSHILAIHPDWFPEYKDRRLTTDERNTLAERLRKWARDASNPKG